MVSRKRLRKNMVAWLGSVLVLLPIIIIVGIFLQREGTNPNNVLLPIFLLIFPSIFFIIGYYGLRHGFTFSRNFIGILVALVIICASFPFGSITISVIFGALGGFPYGIIRKIQIGSLEEAQNFAKKVGIIAFVFGILTLLGIFALLIRTYIVFG